MSSANETGFTPSTLILIGIPGLEYFYIWFAAPLCVIYSVTLLGNCTLLLTIHILLNLHKPMYMFISQLAFCDLVISSSILPKMLGIFWFNAQEISFSACLIQMFFTLYFPTLESSILSAMAFDRYVAICNPLRYTSILTNSLIAKIAVASLVRAVILAAPLSLTTLRLPFCSRYVACSFCENMAVAKLSCPNATFNNVYALVIIVLFTLVDISFIALSYILIISVVLRLPIKEDRLKAFSTCGSHICVILAFYIPILCTISLHRFRNSIPPYVHVIVANIYLLLPPMINPIIYGVIMKEIRWGMLQMFQMIHFRLKLST